jgi:selenocysteine-specific elongation factor
VTAGRLVVGTAGHVDHGKTSLVRALTGVDLDRLPEEKARGITIALGFTPLALPDGRVAGLVDVPGHERLVRTMVAGATGMDAVILCVSAVEGVMPQTREHLDILELLGVSTGVVAMTMADLVDEELLELAVEEAREQVAGTFLAHAPVIATSATTRRGIDELVAALTALLPAARPADRPFRLPVDRAFARRGFGTVVTGTAWAGELLDGAEVELRPGGRRVRVRGIQVHGQSQSRAVAGARTALNLAGLDVEEVGRGTWITSLGAVPDTLVVDARYRHLAGAPAFEGEPRLLVFHGTREVPARVVPCEAAGLAPGWSGFVQLRLAEALPCLPGDRFVLRRESPATTVGGGTVLDPWVKVSRRGHASVADLTRLEAGDPDAWLERAGLDGLTDAECLARAGILGGERLGDRRYAASTLGTLGRALRSSFAAAHREWPLQPWINRKALQHGALAALDERAFQELVSREVASGGAEAEGARVRARGFEVTLDAGQAAWWAAAERALGEAGWEGLAELPEHPQRDGLAFLMRERGAAEQVGGRWLGRVALDRLASVVRGWFTGHEDLDPASFKDLTGLTRRTAIPLLEWLDAAGVTRRVGDVRRRGVG